MRTRRDAVIAVGVLAALLLFGVLLGWLWSRLAPSELSVVVRAGSTAPLPTESQHRFDGLALFALMVFGAGLVSGAALWQWRSQRGPVLLLAGVAASLLSAWVAYRCGLLFAGTPDLAAAAVGTVVTVPPLLGSPIVVVAQPLGMALAYGTAVSVSGDDNLHRDNAHRPEPDPELSCGAIAD